MSAIPLTDISAATIGSEKEKEKNFGLSRAAFEELQQSLRDGDQRLYEKIFLAHFAGCVNFLEIRDKVSKREAYDATMTTMARFCELLAAGKIRYGNMRYLFTRMARQAHQRTVKRQSIFTEMPEQAYLIPEEGPEFPDEEFAVMERAFRFLGRNCQELLKNFYFRNRTLKEIAETENRSAVAVRKQKSRCVATLKRYFYFAS